MAFASHFLSKRFSKDFSKINFPFYSFQALPFNSQTAWGFTAKWLAWATLGYGIPYIAVFYHMLK